MSAIRARTAGQQKSRLAKEIGVCHGILCNVIAGSRDPNVAILKWAGFERVAYRTYRKIEKQQEDAS